MKKYNPNRVFGLFRRCQTAILTLAGAWLIANAAPAQTTNAYDLAADSAYDNSGPPNGLSPGGQNGGFGFGSWTFTILNTGGAFISGSGPSGDSFDLWNTSASSSTIAVRPFSSPLVPGQSFSVELCLNSLDNSGDTNALVLQDASGNTLFSYWHVGYEPNNGVNGEYSDATTNNGAAVNFQYAYQHFQSFTFTLNSPTSYTFTDNSTGASFTGTIANAQIAQVAFVRGNSSAGTGGGGDDFQFDVLQILSATPPTFGVIPAQGALSVTVTNSIAVNVAAGSAPLNLNSVTLLLDGSSVTPTVGGSSSLMTVNYVPNPPLSAGVTHTAQLVVQDQNAVSYTNIWSFTTGFASLPAVLPGPFTVSNNVDLTIFTAAGDTWLGSNYLSTSSQTLYARFSMEFDTTNDTSSIYTFGGMDFFQGGNEKLLFGKNGGSANWSIAINGANGPDLNPAVTVVTNDWHTIVVRIDYQNGAPANETVWLDPDFTQTEANQPQSPVTLSADNTFDNVHLRSGFNDAVATYSNIVIAATSAGIGFVAPSSPTFEGFVPGQNAGSAPTNTPISVEVLFGTYGINTNNVTLNLDGNNVTPAFNPGVNSFTVSYQSPTPFAAGSTHNVTVSLTDSNGAPYSTSWSFTVDAYPSLPVTVPGPIDVFSGQDDILFTAQNEWLGNNYGSTSTNTLYTRFSMTFFDLNGETGGGGGFGGLEFYLGTTEQFLVGNNWLSTNWSVSVETENTADIPPVTPIVLGSYHTMVIKSVYSPVTNATVEVWLDPDFTKTEGNQPNPPLVLSINNTFDNIHLRCGNGTAHAQFTNIVLAATAPGVGFPATVPPAVLSIQTISRNVQLSWTGAGTLETAPFVTGPWTDSANQANPQVLSTTNSAQFFRLQQ